MIWHPGYAPLWFHGLTDFLSLTIATWYYIIISRDNTEDSKGFRKKLILIGAILGALIGSRLVASLEHPDLFFNPPSWLYYYSEKTVAGGIAGGILGVELIKKLLGIKKSLGDLMVGPIALGIIIGRIGCFMIGVRDGTVGLVSSLPWAFDQGDGLKRHPTSLYEILFVLLLWISISLYRRKGKQYSVRVSKLSENNTISERAISKNYEGSGLYFRLFIFGYFTFRFFVEFIKPVTPLFLGITAIQWTSLIVVICYGYSMSKMLRCSKK